MYNKNSKFINLKYNFYVLRYNLAKIKKVLTLYKTRKNLLFLLYKLLCLFVHVDRIINFFWYYWRGGEDNQMLKILEYANIWFSRFPYLKGNSAVNCSEFAMRSAQSRERVQLRNLKFPIVSNCELTANSMRFSTLKSGNLKNKHLRILWFWAIDYLHLPFNNIKKVLIIPFTCTISALYSDILYFHKFLPKLRFEWLYVSIIIT